MGFQDAITSKLSSQYFLKNVVEVKASGTATCHKTVVWDKQGHAPVKYFCSTEPLFLSIKFHRDHKTATKMR